MFSKFLNPKNDFAFKRIFGTERNKDILIHFLNDMITFKGDGIIQDVTFLKPAQDPETFASKASMVDILCKDEKGNKYIVEMQVAKEKGFEKRAQYYAAKAYVSQAHSGDIYHDLKEIIFLAIVDFEMFPNKKRYKSDHVILDKESFENDLVDFSFTFLELPKFKKELGQLSNIIEKWSYFFKYAEETSEKDISKIVGTDFVLQRAYEELNRFSWNDQELLTYDQTEKYAISLRAVIDQKKDEGIAEGRELGKAEGIAEGRELGKAEGIAEGMELGKAEGIAEGMELGKAEGIAEGMELGKKALLATIVQNMYRQKVGIFSIVATTGLSKEEIEALIS